MICEHRTVVFAYEGEALVERCYRCGAVLSVSDGSVFMEGDPEDHPYG